MMARRSVVFYSVLLGVWGVLIGWQAAEHLRVRREARDRLSARARDISETLEAVLKFSYPFPIIQERLEPALQALIKPGELEGIALLNVAGEVVTSAGAPISLANASVRSGAHWGPQYVTIGHLIDLGTNLTSDLPPTVVSLTNFPPPGVRPQGPRLDRNGQTNQAEFQAAATNLAPASAPARPPGERRGRWSPSLSPELREKVGVHSFVMALSLDPVLATARQDLWMRSMIAFLATVSVVGSGLAWRNLTRFSELQFRLIRASELNSHLREMNIAAAGLAHETRNPLNIIRGLAQMISKQQDAPPEVRQKLREIMHETDRVTAQLNEFINYSRPREVRFRPVSVQGVVQEVVRALSHDLEEKQIQLSVSEQPMVIEADEQLFRQMFFNLLMNAIQSVSTDGRIEVRALRITPAEGCLEIHDNGHGVSPEHRTEIFKPYFTTRAQGTGLGLAVVQQIVLAHGWEIQCAERPGQGAVFRLNLLKLVNS